MFRLIDSRLLRGSRVLSCVSMLILLVINENAMSQAPPAPSPAKRAVDERKAIFTLIGANFRPLAERLQGRGSLTDVEARKRAERVAFLATLSSEAFSDVSNVAGPVTRARPEIWSRRDDFDKVVTAFLQHTQSLSQVAASQGLQSEAFKSALTAVAEDCKACHDEFRVK